MTNPFDCTQHSQRMPPPRGRGAFDAEISSADVGVAARYRRTSRPAAVGNRSRICADSNHSTCYRGRIEVTIYSPSTLDAVEPPVVQVL